MAQSGEVAIGFEGLDAAGETPDQSSYTVKFSASTPEPDVNEKSEEIVLLEKKGDSSKAEEDQNSNEKVCSVSLCVHAAQLASPTVESEILSFCDYYY